MASPHFLLFPFMAQGHTIPMIDIAKLLARRGSIITIVLTPESAARNHSSLTHAIDSGLQIRVAQLEFPWKEGGLPEGCENFDMLPSRASAPKFIRATFLLAQPSEKLFHQLKPRPNCIISDKMLPWTFRLAQKFHVPRLSFSAFSCFFVFSSQLLWTNNSALTSSDSDPDSVIFSGLPDPVKFRKFELPRSNNKDLGMFGMEMAQADAQSYGIVFNTSEEVESEYVAKYRKTRASPEKVWCVGPVWFCNKDKLEQAQRGNKATINEEECISWLDRQQPNAVVYVSFGSVWKMRTTQLVELGLGLEASNKPFIWVIGKANLKDKLLKWLEEYDLEGKTKGRGLVIRGWAPQVLILSHPAIGCFMTHCGWNASIEGISAGVPMITWPLFGDDQVYNDKLIVQVLKVGVNVGLETIKHWEEEDDKEKIVKKDKVREAVEKVLDGDESEEMRGRSKKLAEMAKRAVEEEGSSYRNITLLIEDIIAYGESSENGSC